MANWETEPGWCEGTVDCVRRRYMNSTTESGATSIINDNDLCLTLTMPTMANDSFSGAIHGFTSEPTIEDICEHLLGIHPDLYDTEYRYTGTSIVAVFTKESCSFDSLYSTWGNEDASCYDLVEPYLTRYDADTWSYLVCIKGSVNIYSEPTVYPPTCPPGYEFVDGECVKCVSTFFEILKNVNFAQLTDEDTAIYWESQDVKYNQISQSDFVPAELDNIAHFGDHTCEYIKQPLTIDNGEYRYNNTITLKIEFSYIDVRTATPDSKIVINLGGELEIFDIARIKTELTGDSGLYSYNLSSAIAYIEFPAPAVSPGEFAIAEMWQMGNIVAEVTQFGILGYDPCVKTELYDIEATEEIIECTPPPPCIPQYLYNQDLYRRQIVTFKTDIQGLIPQYLDKIMISHSALQWGEAGQVAVRDLDNLTLSENLVDLTDGKTIVFRDINGDISGAYGVGILDEYNIQVPGMPEWVTVNTFYTIQEMATAKEFLVISVRPSGDDVTIECVNYDENIYKDGGC